ncbi:MAG: Hemolysins and related proteins containing CBS domains [uncultured Thermomicrobiales bacterium]|uniref:Hemolysins and related proteins containing CBS domains n=1 Tax=uncultured Thermomicrobiales bacterium TaxID=1645740 RepID=A0A6J4UZC4_9BACT|nr:MAG: Hemolysins and related proteins containing CBS domains [uncultured Thermomicrobiales bacterium]
MEPASLIELGAALVCLLLVALSAATEAALGYASRHKVRALAESGRRGALTVDRLLEHPRAYGSAMILLQTVAAVALTMFVADLARREGLPGEPWSALLIVTAALIILGHGLPRALARHDPERIGTALAWFASFGRALARPIVILVDALTGLLVRALTRRAPGTHPEPATEEELTVVISGGEGGEGYDGVIEEDEREMIDGILQLEDRTARDIMVPRLDIVAVPEGADLAEVVRTIEGAGHSRLPVYSDSIDSIIGVLYAKDLLRFVPGASVGENGSRAVTAPFSLASLIRPVYIVPEAKRVDDLLHELQGRKVHMAVVVDEYGGTAGVVTIEDILEEIVGEIDDEYDVATEPDIEEIGDHELRVDGRIGAEEVSDLLDLDWIEEEHNTIGGLVQRELGRLPAEGEKVEFGGARITVLAVEGYRIKRLRVEKLGGPGPGADATDPASK